MVDELFVLTADIIERLGAERYERADACLYKSDTGAVDEILDTDITITLIREQKPKKFLGQLQNKYEVIKKGKGIYNIEGMLFPMQIIATKELEKRSLTRSMDRARAEELSGDSYWTRIILKVLLCIE